MTEPNPYESPVSVTENGTTTQTRILTKRHVAVAFCVFPFIIAFPLRYWIMNHAGSWVVSTDLEPYHREVMLGITFLANIAIISVVSFFAASLILFLDRCHRIITGTLTVLLGILLIPALLWIWIMINSYLRFG